MSTIPTNQKLKRDRVDVYATHGDLNRALRHFIAMQNQSAADDLIYHFAGGVEPVRRIALENEIVHAPRLAKEPQTLGYKS